MGTKPLVAHVGMRARWSDDLLEDDNIDNVMMLMMTKPVDAPVERRARLRAMIMLSIM